MALRLAGEEIGIQEKVEALTYSPNLQDSGDLEAGTKTITATSEASGLGNADYSKALTLANPDDARLVIKRMGTRLAVTIDSFDTATHLYCRVYVDAQDADHRLFDEDWDSTGAKLDATSIHSALKSTIFNLLKDGTEHTFYFFFWIDQANNAIISLVQLWECVGSGNVNDSSAIALEVVHTGFLSFAAKLGLQGTGTAKARFRPVDDIWVYYIEQNGEGRFALTSLLAKKEGFTIWTTLGTDISYLDHVWLNLRSMQ